MRLGAVRAVCRVLLVALVVAGAMAAAWSQAVAAPPPAGPGDPLADAKQRVADAQNEANAAAARFAEAESRYEELGEQIATIQQKISSGEDRAAHLREITQRRAIVAYKSQGAGVSVVLGTNNPSEGLRSSILLQAANESDNEAVAEYAVVAQDLATLRAELANQRKLQKEVLEKFSDERKLLDAKLAGSQKAMSDLEARAQAAKELVANLPVVDGMICPVPGAAFTNDFGQPRSGHTHQGNDLFAPMGTPNLAVVAGNVTYGPGGSGGNGAYLAGDNGVTYVYYHLSEYVGGPRHVNQGEVIAKLGQSGNAGAPHTHFEIRPGGRNAPAINPYPSLIKVC